MKDYTFTGQIRPMKLVFFDLQRDTTRLDASRYSEPLSFPPNVVTQPAEDIQAGDLYYNNKIMNFYGDSFHITTPGYNYTWTYEPASANRLVVSAPRINAELDKTYVPQQIKLGTFQTSSTCQLVLPSPTTKPWPTTCDDVNGAAIRGAIEAAPVGYMHLNGKRLGNLSAIEAIPNRPSWASSESDSRARRNDRRGDHLERGRARRRRRARFSKDCRTKSLTDCFIGRFGWLGDRVSLEDQVANAAFVEMNMTTSEGYQNAYGNDKVPFPIRYAFPNCGPANKTCVESKGNADLTERDIDRMAEYARWVGNPTRSEFEVSLPDVIAGERRSSSELNCDTCHVDREDQDRSRRHDADQELPGPLDDARRASGPVRSCRTSGPIC